MINETDFNKEGKEEERIQECYDKIMELLQGKDQKEFVVKIPDMTNNKIFCPYYVIILHEKEVLTISIALQNCYVARKIQLTKDSIKFTEAPILLLAYATTPIKLIELILSSNTERKEAKDIDLAQTIHRVP